MSAYSVYYLVCLIISTICTIIFIARWTNQIPVHYALIFMLLPITLVGYLMLSMSTTLEEALLANKLTYFGGCFIQPLVLFSLLSLFKINLRKITKTFLYATSIAVFSFVLTIGFNESFYKSATLEIATDGAVILHKEYGPVHVLHYISIILYLSVCIIMLGYTIFSKRKNVSVKTVRFYVAIEVLTVFSFFFGRMITKKIEMITAAYVITQIFLLIIMSYISLYNVAANAVAMYEEHHTNGFISFDKHGKYIGANAAALRIYPGLADVHVDRVLDPSKDNAFEIFNTWLKRLEETRLPADYDITVGDRYFRVNTNFLKNKSKIIGYCISLDDVTQSRRYTHLLEDYSHKLNDEVTYKTEHIKEMQDKMLLSFADMIENRDSSTGGHIKRTSQAIRFLVAELLGERKDADRHFCSCLINAAPLHDIGKIAVPDSILQKTGKYEPWEYEIMKTHSAKGAEIIHKALADYDDPDFKRIAENIAHYHHERWDGNGYPLGLTGTDIPLEARIMAIADVYDALVSKRCYKDRYSFEDAYNIIMDGMGTQFDPSLAKYFAQCRNELEYFYTLVRKEEDS